jgi:hypothetical protein
MELNLEWLKLLPFLRGKLVGMVSVNYKKICRIMPWLVSKLRIVAKKVVFVPPINKPVWRAVECRSWLRVRDSPMSNINAIELRATAKR